MAIPDLRRLLFLLVSIAALSASAAQGAPASKRGDAFVLSTGERLSLPEPGKLAIRQGGSKAFLSLPADVQDILGVDEAATGGAIVLRLGRECPPDRKLTISHAVLQARLLVAKEGHGRGAVELPTLRKAVALAPDQGDLRLKLVKALVAAGERQEAEEAFSEGIRVTPFEMAWGARQGNELAVLVAKLPAAKTRVDLQYRDHRELAPAGVAWSSSRRLTAFVDDLWNLHVTAAGNSDVFEAALAWGRDLDSIGEVIPAAQPRVAKRVAAAEAMLAQLGFVSLPADQLIKAERNDEPLSWVRWKAGDVVASAGTNVIRVRRAGKVIFERKIDTVGVLALDWGVALPEEGLLLLAWRRVAGNDTCPNGVGIDQVPLPATQR